jgi:glycosyltransferase involved in cell wall biosynthesis
MKSYTVLVVAGEFEEDNKPGNTQPFIDRQIESLRKIGVDIISFSIRGWESKKIYLKAISKINTLIEEKNISLIHAHYVYSAIASSFQKKVPVIASLMGDDVYGTPDKSGKTSLSGYWEKSITKLFLKKWKVVIVKSNEMRNLLNHRRIFVIPNGVDLNFFKPIERKKARGILSWDGNKHHILFGGDPSNPRKNFPLAEQVIKILEGKDWNVEIHSLMKIPHSQVPIYLSASEALLFTSFREGSPNIIKEALACNLPIVTVKVGDVEERLAGLPNCFIEEYNENSLANKLKQVLLNKEKMNFRDSLNDIEINTIAHKIKKVYEETLS